MKPTDFTSFEDPANIKRVAENVDTDGVKFTLLNMREMRYTKDQKLKNLSSDPDYRTVSYGPKCTRSLRPKGPIFCELQPVYPKEGVLIATKKYEDIHDKLMQYIPPVHHQEYHIKHATKRANEYKFGIGPARELETSARNSEGTKLKQFMEVLERLLRLNDDLL